MMSYITPFKLIGNVYFVGTYSASSHLIDTGRGLILIDAGYSETAEIIINSMQTLGFDIKELKYILISHGHKDHSGGAPILKSLSGADIYMNTVDNNYLNGFVPDHDIKNGTKIRLGNTEIMCMETPGHTPGTISFFFDVVENGKSYRAGMFGGAGVNQLKKSFLEERGYPLSWRDDFLNSIDKLNKIKVDVFIGNHSWHNHTRENYEIMKNSNNNPFINPDAWNKFLNSTKEKMLKIIKEENSEVNFI